MKITYIESISLIFFAFFIAATGITILPLISPEVSSFSIWLYIISMGWCCIYFAFKGVDSWRKDEEWNKMKGTIEKLAKKKMPKKIDELHEKVMEDEKSLRGGE